jgi:Transcription factor Iwr1
MYDRASDDEEDEEGYDDEDDENAENNWRNDYPDTDPMYFERLHLDENYSSGDDSGFIQVLL